MTLGEGEDFGSHLLSTRTMGAGADGMLLWTLAWAVWPTGETGEYLPGVLSRSRLPGLSLQMEYGCGSFWAVLAQLDLSPLWADALVVSNPEEIGGELWSLPSGVWTDSSNVGVPLFEGGDIGAGSGTDDSLSTTSDAKLR